MKSLKSQLERLNLPFDIGGQRKLFTEKSRASSRMKLQMKGDPKTGELFGEVVFGPIAMGPPGHAHGGAQAYVLDEIMGSVVWYNHVPGVAQKLEFQYLQMAPLKKTLQLHAKVVRVSKSKVRVRGEIRMGEKVLTIGTGTFHRLNPRQLAEVLKHASAKDLKILKGWQELDQNSRKK